MGIAIPSSGVGHHRKGIAVQDEKKKTAKTPLPKKSYWHLYSLQNLGSEKLIKVVNKILKQEYHLVK